ncbi:hypothetical protein BDZ89DRAFT_960147 [Hymenopellis radicata]|nr:hypothetical protein BDZ89DRAFT_960147 [Hymenopellis radicata]
MAAIAFIAALLFAIFLRVSRSYYHDTVASIQQVLRPDHPLSVLLSARARPNRRLIRAFELTNTFVSGDEYVHSTFRGEAELLISRANDWHRFRRVADHAVSDALPVAPRAPCRFDTFVQAVTLQSILLGLLCVDAPDDIRLDVTALHTVSALVTELWALSKQPGALDARLLPVLRDHVDALLRSAGTTLDAFPNPLDIIIPSWETLWRVVATTLAHIHDDASYRDVMHEFFASSITAHSFRRPHADASGVSVEGIVLESMRLHPPSKHIGRSQPWLLPRWIYSRLPFAVARFFEVVHVADVYAVQNSPVYWGASVDSFDPSRQRHGPAFMAFGYGKLSCVAKTWAPIAAAVIVASILERVDDASFHIKAGKEIGGRHGWEDWHVYVADSATSKSR